MNDPSAGLNRATITTGVGDVRLVWSGRPRPRIVVPIVPTASALGATGSPLARAADSGSDAAQPPSSTQQSKLGAAAVGRQPVEEVLLSASGEPAMYSASGVQASGTVFNPLATGLHARIASWKRRAARLPTRSDGSRAEQRPTPVRPSRRC